MNCARGCPEHLTLSCVWLKQLIYKEPNKSQALPTLDYLEASSAITRHKCSKPPDPHQRCGVLRPRSNTMKLGCCFVVIYLRRGSVYSPGWSEMHYVDQISPKLTGTHFPLPPEGWDFRGDTMSSLKLAFITLWTSLLIPQLLGR